MQKNFEDAILLATDDKYVVNLTQPPGGVQGCVGRSMHGDKQVICDFLCPASWVFICKIVNPVC